MYHEYGGSPEHQLSSQTPGNGAKADEEAIPAVDRHHSQCQVYQFLFGELPPYTVITLIRRLPLSDERYGFCPFQRDPLAFGAAGRFAPGLKEIEPRFALTSRPRFAGMHLDAESTAVDLRDARFDQLKQRRVEPAILNIRL